MTPTTPPDEHAEPEDRPAGGEDLFGLRGKTAVITGGTRGIGLMIAQGLAEAGAEVLVVGRDRDAAAAAAERLGGRGRFVAGDLSTESGVCDLAKRIVDLDLGGVDSREQCRDRVAVADSEDWRAPVGSGHRHQPQRPVLSDP